MQILLAFLALLLWFLNNRQPAPMVIGDLGATEGLRNLQGILGELKQAAEQAYYVGLRDGALGAAILLIVLYLLTRKE